MNWINDTPGSPELYMATLYGRSLREAYRFGCNLVIMDATVKEWDYLNEAPPEKRRIDVWWQDDPTGNFMLLLAHLIAKNADWAGAEVRVLATREDNQVDNLTEEVMKERLRDVRIDAAPMVVSNFEVDTVIKYSQDASLVLLPMQLRDFTSLSTLGCSPEVLFNRLPLTALVLAAETIELDADPEEGEAAERANALDALSDAEKRAQKAQKEADKAATTAQALTDKLSNVQSSVVLQEDESLIVELMADIHKAERELEVKKRRLAKEKAKADAAAREAEALGAKDPEDLDDKER
jgi:hypothetical protein